MRVLQRRRRFDEVAVEAGIRELSEFYFHSPDNTPPPPRTVEGEAAPLPLEAPVLVSGWDDLESQDVDDANDGVEPADENVGPDGF